MRRFSATWPPAAPKARSSSLVVTCRTRRGPTRTARSSTTVKHRMRMAQEEIFGPVAALIEVDGLDDALRIANDTIYGLAASVWTSDLRTAHAAVRGLEAGVIYVNCYDHGDPTQP